jgi:hypothetical protein
LSSAARRRAHLFAGGALAAAVVTAGGAARADDSIVSEGTNPFYGGLYLGPAIGIGSLSGGAAFKLGQIFGYHFSGDASGPALGFRLEETFPSGFFILELGPKFWWDIQPSEDLALYIAPEVYIGYGGAFASGGSGHGFNFGFGVEGKVILGNVGVITFKPLCFDFIAGDAGRAGSGVAAAYNLMFGGGFAF